jgi:hypothetical protein
VEADAGAEARAGGIVLPAIGSEAMDALLSGAAGVAEVVAG